MKSAVPTLALLLLVAPLASAQEARKLDLADTATVIEVDETGNLLTVRGDDGSERRIGLDATTRVQRGAEQIPLGTLKPGDRVAISARHEGATPTEQPIADVVQLVVESGGQEDVVPPVAAPGTRAPVGAEGTPPVAAAPSTAPATAGETRVMMIGAGGQEHGELVVRDTHAGLLVHVSLRGLPPGRHGFHVHQVGRCEPPFESAGDHLAPEGRRHGFLSEGGPHGGDLPNLVVGDDGRVEQEVLAPDLQLAELLDTDGAAFIVHEKADDYTSQPSGGAGGRIACGAVGGEQLAR